MARQKGNLPPDIAAALEAAREKEAEQEREPKEFVFRGEIEMKVVLTDEGTLVNRWFLDGDLQNEHRVRSPDEVAHKIGWQHIINCLDNPQVDLSTMPAYQSDDDDDPDPGQAQCFLTINLE